MRITSGIYGGRTLLVPKTGDIRPTQDRVRQALFSMLMAEVASSRFLDVFAGSGAVGLEALSRGAAHVTFVEQNPRHLDVIRKNLLALTGKPDAAADSQADCVRADAYRWISSFSGQPYDIAFADPPYALGQKNGYADFLVALANRDVVRPGGIFAAEMTSSQTPDDVPGWSLFRRRPYGKTLLCLWSRLPAHTEAGL